MISRLGSILLIVAIGHAYAISVSSCPNPNTLIQTSEGKWEAKNNLGLWQTNPKQNTPFPESVNTFLKINANNILSIKPNISAVAGQIECVYQNSDTKETLSLITPTQPNKYNLILQQNGGNWSLTNDLTMANCTDNSSFFCEFTY